MPQYQMSDGEYLTVREFGQGQPVLVLSGLGMSSWHWLPFLLPHRQQFRFIIPDWRGFGGSKYCALPNNSAIESHWLDLSCLIQQFAHSKYLVITYSMGASIAMHGMKYDNFSAKMSAYLHIDQSPKISNALDWPYGLYAEKQPIFKQHLQQLTQFLQLHSSAQTLTDLSPLALQQFYQLWADFMAFQGGYIHRPFKYIAQYCPKMTSRFSPIKNLGYLYWYLNSYLVHQKDYRSALAQLDCPTHFFIGQKSVLYPAQGQHIIASNARHATVVEFTHSGHALLISEPIKFKQEIKHFLYSYLEHP